jgi:DNA-binding MurR/RpiR family transcriptional regulator
MKEKQETGNIFTNISNNYYLLTTSEKKVADYVLSHQSNVQFMSISELADECGVAEATVSRFCRRLHLRGYNAFKLALAKDTGGQNSSRFALEPLEGEILPEDSIDDLSRKLYATHISALAQTRDLLRADAVAQTAELLQNADKVYCMGQGGSMILAQEAAHLFSTISPKFFAVSDSHMQATATALLTPKDVLLFFSYSGSTRDIVDIMGRAQERKAKTVLFTRFAKSPGAAYADVVLLCGSNEGPLQLGSVQARIAQLFVVDVLFNELCRRMGEEAQQNRESVVNALADKHM